jgi:hypothetical protein
MGLAARALARLPKEIRRAVRRRVRGRESGGVEGVLGDGGSGDAVYMGDDSGMRDGGAGVACGHGSSGPNIDGSRARLRRTDCNFVSSFCTGMLGLRLADAGVESETDVAAVSTLTVENSLSLSDELEEVLEREVALCLGSLGSRIFDLYSVICDGAKRGCRASGGAMSDHDGSRVRGFFARLERTFSSSSEETEREGMCPLRNLGCLTDVATLIVVVGSTGGLDREDFGGELTGRAGTLVLAFVLVGVFTFFANGVLGAVLRS